MTDAMLKDLERRMETALEALKKEFSGLRAGRATTSLLEPVMVSAYGAMMPMNQVGTINAPEPRLLTIQVWDAGLVKSVEKAITDANLGLNPQAEGQLVRVPLPELSQERRTELGKVAGKYAEASRVAIRGVRRDGMESLKKQEKDGDISEDEQHRLSEQVQKLTDKYVGTIDKMLADKEKEIMQV